MQPELCDGLWSWRRRPARRENTKGRQERQGEGREGGAWRVSRCGRAFAFDAFPFGGQRQGQRRKGSRRREAAIAAHGQCLSAKSFPMPPRRQHSEVPTSLGLSFCAAFEERKLVLRCSACLSCRCPGARGPCWPLLARPARRGRVSFRGSGVGAT